VPLVPELVPLVPELVPLVPELVPLVPEVPLVPLVPLLLLVVPLLSLLQPFAAAATRTSTAPPTHRPRIIIGSSPSAVPHGPRKNPAYQEAAVRAAFAHRAPREALARKFSSCRAWAGVC
jgi:hypothetical protein